MANEAAISAEIWEVLEEAGLKELAERDVEVFAAEYRRIAAPGPGDEQAQQDAKDMAASMPPAYFVAHQNRRYTHARRTLIDHLRSRQKKLPASRERRHLDSLFDRVIRIATATTPPQEAP